MQVKRGEARATDLDFLPSAGHATSLAAGILWTLPLTVLDPGGGGVDLDVVRTVGGRGGVPVGGIFCGSWAGGDKEADVRLANG